MENEKLKQEIKYKTECEFTGSEGDYYLVFILGYDLLQNKLAGIPCDYCFDMCKHIIKLFYKSEEIKDYSIGIYDALQKFINNNYDYIEDYISGYFD